MRGIGALFRRRKQETAERLKERLHRFRDLVEKNDRVLELIADAGEKLGGEYVFDRKYLDDLVQELSTTVHGVVEDLNLVTGNAYPDLLPVVTSVDARVKAALECGTATLEAPLVVPLDETAHEHAYAVGEKLARLGEIGSRLGCRVPEGFVVTTRACREFLEDAGVDAPDVALRELWEEGGRALENEAGRLRARILDARLPRGLARDIRREIDRLGSRGDTAVFAVRSSAPEEDGELTFAGQYETVLGVAADGVLESYKRVVASLYSPGVIQYRRHHGLPPGCGLMAVGCLRMVPARASGVVYTVDPSGPEADVQLVSAAWGLGKVVVEGEAPVDRYQVRRVPGYPVSHADVAHKEWKYVVPPGGGLEREPLAEEERDAPALPVDRVSELAEMACRIERYMKAAQDIEWALDGEGRLFILQARPLTLPPGPPVEDDDLSEAAAGRPVLLEGKGEVACRGIGIGRVRVVGEEDLPTPEDAAGAVLVARAAAPRLGGMLAGASAVVTDLGSATGHFAAVARDFRVPTIVAAGDATERLREGMEVTVDAEENVVYEGRIDALLRHQLLRRASFEDTPEFRALRRVLRRVAPLNLRDPQGRGFAADQCRTYHDVIRFAHEKAIAELTEIGWVAPSRDRRYVRRLELSIPLDLVLVDLGGGLRTDGNRSTAMLADVTSRPLVPLLEALTEADVWQTAPADMDLDGFMASATRSMSLTGPLAAKPTQNLAMISPEYLHLSLRLGYHFNIVDAYLADEWADNYIYFRFAGGVTELTRRSRRATLLKKILERHGFVTEGRGDLVIGRLKGVSPEVMTERLRMLGRLIGFTRQLDIFLRSDPLVDRYVERFLGEAPTIPTLQSRESDGGTMKNAAEVLVLDDEPVVCERLQNHLEKKGYQVEVFTESQKAIDRLADKRFDVVITDVKMAGPTGLDVLRFVRDQGLGTRVIVITAYGSIETAREAEYSGAFGFVNKPFTAKAIEAMTRKAVREARKAVSGKGK